MHILKRNSERLRRRCGSFCPRKKTRSNSRDSEDLKLALDKRTGMWHYNKRIKKGLEGVFRELFSIRERKPPAENFLKFR